jgi:uncharacterized membrane protein YkgB
VPAQHARQAANGTYSFSDRLGTVEIVIGLLVLAGLFSTTLGALGALLALLTSFVTLSFPVRRRRPGSPRSATRACRPCLSGGRWLVLKEVMLWAGGLLLLLVDSAR